MRPTEILYKTASVKKFTNYRDLGFKYKAVRIPALKDEIKSRQPRTECELTSIIKMLLYN